MPTATYTYCIVKASGKPALARVPPGMPDGGRPQALKGPGDVWVIASDVPLPEYGAERINQGLSNMEWVAERALAHEAVVEFCARRADVIPLKLFTIFRDANRAVSGVGSARDLSAIFRRVRGCAEWSVRVSCTPPALERPGRRAEARPASGAAFLRRKKAERDDARRRAFEARRSIEEVYSRLSALAKAGVRKDSSDVPGSTLLLDAAFLVSRTRRAAFTREVRKAARAAAKSGCAVVLSGPWPPYHFVAER